MKKLILTLTLFSLTSLLFSQVSVEGVNINELDINYCSMYGYNKSIIGQNIIITVDYGQKHKVFKSQLIKDAEGKAVNFNSMIDALNFMEKNGWEYLNNTEYTTGNQVVSHFLLKRKE